MLLVFCSCDLICVACVWYLPRFRFACLVASTVVIAGWLVFSLVDICGFASLPVDLFDLVGIVLLDGCSGLRGFCLVVWLRRWVSG